MSVMFVRHTTPRVAPGVCYGRTDLPLADSFDDEAAAVARAMPNADRIVSSPLQRCRQLAERLAEEAGLPLAIDERLVEMDFGAWEARPWSDIPREEIDAWMQDFLHARPHGGESVAMLRARALAAATALRDRPSMTLAVTHAGVIKAVLADGDQAANFKTHVDFGGFAAMPPAQGASSQGGA